MKQFSDCSGPCEVCAAFGCGCLAGHGDDDFSPHSREKLEEMLKTGMRRRTPPPLSVSTAPEYVSLTEEQKETIENWIRCQNAIGNVPGWCKS